jgi:hypothetical protein
MALAFTIGSFWWLQARQGKLISYQPHFFAFAQNARQAIIRFPLVLYNTGPKPIVVLDLRLSFPDEPAVTPLPWRTSRSQLKPQESDNHQFPAVFSVSGRQAQQHFIEFGLNSDDPLPGIDLKANEHNVQVEALLGHKRKWQTLVSFPLEGKHIDRGGAYLTYSNTALRPIS